MRLVCLLLTLASFLSADSYTISGTVVEHSSGAPVRHARVSITATNGTGDELFMLTGADGAFSFSGLAADKYALLVYVHGRQQVFREHEGFSTLIATGPKQNSEHILFRLNGAATLSGTVQDENGDPVPNATVWIFHRGVVSGRFKMTRVNQTNANAEGEFHFSNLAPGAYYLAVEGHPWFAQYQPRSPGTQGAPQLDSVYPITYYGGSTNPAEAVPLTLTEGAANEIHMQLHAVPSLHIQIEGATMGDAPQLFQRGPGGVEVPFFETSFVSEDKLELMGVAPGEYWIEFAQTFPNKQQWLGRTSVRFAADGVIRLDELQKSNISGTVAFAQGEKVENTGLLLESVSGNEIVQCQVGQDGAFHFDPVTGGRVSPGRYELRLTGRDLYMKSVAVKGAEYSRGELDLREDSQVQISMTAANGAKVNGVAMKEGQPFGGAMILLIPQDFSHGAAIPRDQSDSDGTFTLTAVAPGHYTLLAIEGAEELAYHDPAAIAPYLKQGQSITIPLPPDAATKVEVQRLIP